MSGVVVRLLAPPDPLPPVPGLVLLTYPASCVPTGAVRGEPRFKPWPAMNWQLVPSTKPMSEKGWSTIVPPLGATPGKLRNAAALVPAAARARNCDVSYQPPVVDCCALLLSVSYEKKAKILLRQIGPPAEPPISLKRFSSRTFPQCCLGSHPWVWLF